MKIENSPQKFTSNMNKNDYEMIAKISERARLLFAEDMGIPTFDIRMDLIHTMEGETKLDLQKLWEFDDYNFAHDVLGIHFAINACKKKLEDGFLPRCAK